MLLILVGPTLLTANCLIFNVGGLLDRQARFYNYHACMVLEVILPYEYICMYGIGRVKKHVID